MALNYDKIRRKVEEGGNHWTSYSDLFLVLSVVFLLLYTIANIRSGAMTIAQQAALTTARQEAENLKKQIHTYDVLKDDYLQNGASQDQVKVYNELIDQMGLLESNAKTERDDLAAKAHEADEKQKALNHYQQMVKNIITANLVASGKVKKGNMIIESQDKDIENLNQTMTSKEKQIENNNQTIQSVKDQLATQIKEVEFAYRSKKHAKEKAEKEVARLTAESEAKIHNLNAQNDQVVVQLNDAKSKIEAKNREAEKLMETLHEKEGYYQKAIADASAAHKDAEARERAEFEDELTKARVDADSKVAQEREFASKAEKKRQAYQSQVDELNGDLAKTRQKMATIEGDYRNSLNSLKNANQSLESDLKASAAKLNAQRMLAAQIKKNFAAAGIDASVDGKSGDVTINFQNEYFDTGRADLKAGMRSILEKAIPTYARSLLENPKVSNKITSVEVVGFASPTYKNKSVNPDSLAPDDRAAVNYNMDLSYQRAKSIFEYIFDTNKMQFADQKKLLGLVKVSGRSYLATEKISGRTLSSDNFCDVYDCKKSQKVIIKFNLKDE